MSHNAEGTIEGSPSLENALNGWVDTYRLVLRHSDGIVKGVIFASQSNGLER